MSRTRTITASSPQGGNLDPIPEGSYHNRGSAFGLWLNGGVLLGPAAHEVVARARGLGAEGAWVILRDLEIEWQKSRLARIPMIDWCRGNLELTRRNPRLTYTGGNAWTWIDGAGASGAGTETYLSDGGAILWALYTAVLGIQADFQGITLEPHVPAALADVRTELRLLGRQVTFRFRGSGDKLESLALNGQPARGNRLSWSELNDGADIVAVLSAEGSRPGKK